MKLSVSKKVFTITGLILLLVSLPMSIKLVQQNQENRSQAVANDNQCSSKGQCQIFDKNVKENSACNVIGWAGKVTFGLCTGGNDRRCCVKYEDKGCSSLGGKCIKTSSSAKTCSVDNKSGDIVTGKCGGDSTIRCCVPDESDDDLDEEEPEEPEEPEDPDEPEEPEEPEDPDEPEEPEEPKTSPVITATPTKNEIPEPPEEPKQVNVPKISFKFAFGGLKPKAMCMSGEEQSFTTIELLIGNNNKWVEIPFEEVAGENNNYGDQVYKVVDLELNESEFGVVGSSNFIKIKGPIYTAVKLCTNNQSTKAGDASGCNVKFDNTMMNFVNYPLIAGDINGDIIGHRNGIINGQDWAYIKARVEEENGEEVCPKEGDINFDGIINGSDIQILKNRLGTSDE